jgi:hypothetical protein
MNQDSQKQLKKIEPILSMLFTEMEVISKNDDALIYKITLSEIGDTPAFMCFNLKTSQLCFGDTQHQFRDCFNYADLDAVLLLAAIKVGSEEFAYSINKSNEYDNSLYATLWFKSEKVYVGSNHLTLNQALGEFFNNIPKAKEFNGEVVLNSQVIAPYKVKVTYSSAENEITINECENNMVESYIRSYIKHAKY